MRNCMLMCLELYAYVCRTLNQWLLIKIMDNDKHLGTKSFHIMAFHK